MEGVSLEPPSYRFHADPTALPRFTYSLYRLAKFIAYCRHGLVIRAMAGVVIADKPNIVAFHYLLCCACSCRNKLTNFPPMMYLRIGAVVSSVQTLDIFIIYLDRCRCADGRCISLFNSGTAAGLPFSWPKLRSIASATVRIYADPPKYCFLFLLLVIVSLFKIA